MVLSADTDVFVLLCSHFQKYGWLNASIYMRDPRQNETKIISINKTVGNHQDLIPSLISLHTLTGCDSVPSMYGIGKSKGIQAAKKIKLINIGNEQADIDNVIDEGKRFVAACYSRTDASSSQNRHSL